MTKPSECLHERLVWDGGDFYCPDCNSFFTRAELLRLNEVKCEHCSATLVVDEICFCRG